jgi:hypothetical protein
MLAGLWAGCAAMLMACGGGGADSALPLEQTPTTRTGSTAIDINLDLATDYSRSQMLADMVKAARTFNKLYQAGGPLANVDSDGWPTEDFSLILFNGIDRLGGVYKASFTGRADVAANGVPLTGVNYTQASNTSSFDLVISDADSTVVLDFANTGNGVRNLKIMRPGHTTDEIWNRAFLALLQPFGTLRSKDTTVTDDSQIATWSQRRRPTDAQWTTLLAKDTVTREPGIPWEAVIHLSNITSKDAWVSIPHQADDDYVRNLATLLHTTLRPGLKVYVEYSNEVWNGIYQQHDWNLAAAVAEAGAGDPDLTWNAQNINGYWAARRVARRLIQIGNIFKEVMGEGAFGTRFRPVYATFIANPTLTADAMDMVRARYGPPRNYFHAVAVAPYQLVPNTGDAAALLASLRSFNAATEYFYAEFAAHARTYELPIIAYEGGPDMTGDFDPATEQARYAAVEAANNDPAMEEISYQFLKQWFDAGFGGFAWYKITSPYSESWGLTDRVNRTDTPKMRAVRRIMQERG